MRDLYPKPDQRFLSAAVMWDLSLSAAVTIQIKIGDVIGPWAHVP